MERKNTKMKHSALSSNYEDVGLKGVTSLQCSWIKSYLMKVSMNGK